MLISHSGNTLRNSMIEPLDSMPNSKIMTFMIHYVRRKVNSATDMLS